MARLVSRLAAAIAMSVVAGAVTVAGPVPLLWAADSALTPVAKPKAPGPKAPVLKIPVVPVVPALKLLAQPAKAPERAPEKASEQASGKAAAAAANSPYAKVVEVFTGDTTIAGEKVSFPKGNPGIKSVVVTMAPGEKTAWHRHGTPLYAYILEGELTVTYQGLGDRHYSKGDGFLEAMQVAQQGYNPGLGPVRILAVFLTGDGGQPTIAVKGPEGAK